MSTMTAPLPSPGLPPEPISVADYHRLIRSGILTEEDKVELLEGRIVPKMARNPPHESSLLKLSRKLPRVLSADAWDVRIQMAITLGDSEPEPDAAVVRHSPDDYAQHHPGPNDVGMLAEVANTSLAEDRDKARIYARARIVCYWIVNVTDRQIEVYTDPDPQANPPRYRQRQDYTVGQSVPLVLDGQTVALLPVAELLP
jgi:Uma2 family endonuclease